MMCQKNKISGRTGLQAHRFLFLGDIFSTDIHGLCTSHSSAFACPLWWQDLSMFQCSTLYPYIHKHTYIIQRHTQIHIMHIQAYTETHIHAHRERETHIYTYRDTHKDTHVQIISHDMHTHTCTHRHIYTCMHTQRNTHTNIQRHIYRHTHTHTFT